MSDLISREALKKVIKANHYLLSAKNNSTDYGMFTTGIMQAIDNAPTVEITKPQSYCMGFADGLVTQNYEKPSMFERPQGEWIPVSERLPERYKEVIVTDIETIYAYQSRYIGDGYWECDNGTSKNRIIAWQPLPEPYKKGGAENE